MQCTSHMCVCWFLFKSKKKILHTYLLTHRTLMGSICRELVSLVEMDIACNIALDQLRCYYDLAFSFFIKFNMVFLEWKRRMERLFRPNKNRTNGKCHIKYYEFWLEQNFYTSFFPFLVVNKCRLSEQNTTMLCIRFYCFYFQSQMRIVEGWPQTNKKKPKHT